MKNLIATACNEKYEIFLLHSWFKSLRENVNLDKTDIVIFDFGLSPEVKKKLTKENVIIIQSKTKGKIVNSRFVELLKFLKDRPEYKSILNCDSGDIIFFDDISFLFNKSSDFLAVCEDINPPMHIMMNNNNISNELKNEIYKILKGKKMINAGFLIGPRDKYIELLEFIISNINDFNVWGLDQLLINYYLYKYGFKELDFIYNFIPTTHINNFYCKNGVFYTKNGNKIPVVHNAGGKKFFRPIKKFEYGQNKIKINNSVIWLLRILYKLSK
ncbi:glycosyltransferase [Marinitoga arctica]